MSWALRKYKAPDFSQDTFKSAPDVQLREAPVDQVAPENFHAMSIFPEYFKIGGRWILAKESRMDCVPVFRNGEVQVREFRLLKKGDLVVIGRTENCEEGIFVHTDGFSEPENQASDAFSFRKSRCRETAFSRDYDELYSVLRHDRDHGKIVWVMGPAFAFDYDARNAFSSLIAAGYVHALLAGNALATHDLEAAYLKTALGQDIYSQCNQPNGHYNHLSTINRVKLRGGIAPFIEAEHIDNGIIYSCEKCGVPYVLAGSISCRP